MVACGVGNILLWNNQTQAKRLATDLFDDQFDTCLDVDVKQIDTDLKSYSELTVNEGRVCLNPRTKRNTRAFVQWVKDKMRLDRNPDAVLFPVGAVTNLLGRAKLHEQFVDNLSTVSEAAKPAKFKDEVQWEDWQIAFVNYLRTMPGRNGVPLSCVVRVNDVPNPTPNPNFLDDYVAMAPLNGPAFVTDLASVKILLLNVIVGNEVAEVKVQSLPGDANGREVWITLREHYEGSGVYAMDIVKADDIILNLFHTGKTFPTMHWDSFKRQLNNAHATVEKTEGRVVHSEDQKLRMLLKKVRADFLGSTKTAIEVQLNNVQRTITHNAALKSFRQEVKRKFLSSRCGKGNPRHVNESNTNLGRGGRGGRGGRAGRGGRGGRFGGRNTKNHPNACQVTLKNNKKCWVHASYQLPSDAWLNLKPDDQKKLREERKKCRTSGSNDQSRQIQELQQQTAQSLQAN